MDNNNILEQEILKIRGNKVLAEYLRDTRQYLWYDYLTGEIKFKEIREITIAYQTGKDRSWGIISSPVLDQNHAQHQEISL